MANIIGNNIKILRDNMGFSQEELTVSWRSNRQTDMSGPKHHGSSLFHMTEPLLGKQRYIMKRLIKGLVSGGSMHIMKVRMEAVDPMDWVFQTG